MFGWSWFGPFARTGDTLWWSLWPPHSWRKSFTSTSRMWVFSFVHEHLDFETHYDNKCLGCILKSLRKYKHNINTEWFPVDDPTHCPGSGWSSCWSGTYVCWRYCSFFLNQVVITRKVNYKCFKAHNRRCELSQVYDFLAKRGVAHLTLQVGSYHFWISPIICLVVGHFKHSTQTDLQTQTLCTKPEKWWSFFNFRKALSWFWLLGWVQVWLFFPNLPLGNSGLIAVLVFDNYDNYDWISTSVPYL